MDGPSCSTATGRKLDSSRRNVVPANRLEVSLPMLPRWVFTVWVAWLGAIGLAAALTASRIWNPNPILPVGVSVLMFAAGLGLVIAATVRLICGPRRIRALAGLLVGTSDVLVRGRAHPDGDPAGV